MMLSISICGMWDLLWPVLRDEILGTPFLNLKIMFQKSSCKGGRQAKLPSKGKEMGLGKKEEAWSWHVDMAL